MRLKRLPSAEPKLYDACVDANGWWEEVKATGVLGGGDESDASWSWHAIMVSLVRPFFRFGFKDGPGSLIEMFPALIGEQSGQHRSLEGDRALS